MPAAKSNTLPLFATTKDVYGQIRNFLAGRHVGATRDDALLEEVLKCVFVLMSNNKGEDATSSDDLALARWYRDAFSSVRKDFPGIFDKGEEILLGADSIRFVHEKLLSVDLFDANSDPVGDLFQAFIGSDVRGAEGQFFTPGTACRFLTDAVGILPTDSVVDPACGAGGFLAMTAKRKIAAGVATEEIARQVVGVEKDTYLARMARIHLAVALRQTPRIYAADSLAWKPANGNPLDLDLKPTFDVLLANPPFGSKINAASETVKRSFELGFKWSLDKKSGRYVKTATMQRRTPPQVLFIERCLSLVRPGGRLGLVVPESMMSGRAYRHVIQYLRDRAALRAVVGMPEDLFKTSGKGGTHTKTCLLVATKHEEEFAPAPHMIFMAEAKWCGHDSRGRKIPNDDVPTILENFQTWEADGSVPEDHLGYSVVSEQVNDHVLAPRYYDPEVGRSLRQLEATHDLVVFGELVKERKLSVSTGHEVGKLAYSTGTIPFVRTSDISNWEIKVDPKHGVSEEIFAEYKRKQDVRTGDILMVRDGTYLIGTCAFVTKYDERIVYQSHIYKIRVNSSDLSPYLLLAVLGSTIVKRQIKAKRFTQDIIDSLGDRIHELVLPIPKDPATRKRIADMVEKAISERIEARELSRRARLEVVGLDYKSAAVEELD